MTASSETTATLCVKPYQTHLCTHTDTFNTQKRPTAAPNVCTCVEPQTTYCNYSGNVQHRAGVQPMPQLKPAIVDFGIDYYLLLNRITNTRLGYWAFPVAGPRLWNSLPSNLRQSDLTLHQFHRALKTYLFGWLRLQHLVTFVFSLLYKSSHLLT